MDVEALRLEARETIRDGLELLTDGIEMIESFLQAEVAQVVGTEFVAQEAGELLVLFEEGVFPAGPEDVMAMLDPNRSPSPVSRAVSYPAGRRRSR
jgi:hypothetical protein